MFTVYENNIKVTESESIFEMIKYLFNRGIRDINNKVNYLEDLMYDDGKFRLVNET